MRRNQCQQESRKICMKNCQVENMNVFTEGCGPSSVDIYFEVSPGNILYWEPFLAEDGTVAVILNNNTPPVNR